jgi:hypothetical protein
VDLVDWREERHGNFPNARVQHSMGKYDQVEEGHIFRPYGVSDECFCLHPVLLTSRAVLQILSTIPSSTTLLTNPRWTKLSRTPGDSLFRIQSYSRCSGVDSKQCGTETLD